MVANTRIRQAGILFAVAWTTFGCQVYNRTDEVRSDEQMLPVSFENARAEELFLKAAKTTYGQRQNVRRIGVPSLSLYARGETVAWNANCNDHIRKMDKDGNLIITEREAEAYYSSITSVDDRSRKPNAR
jgi:hypothetical protein